MSSRLPRPTGSAVAAGVLLLWVGAIVAIGFWAIFPDRSEPADIVEIVGRSDSTELILRVQHGSCEADGPLGSRRIESRAANDGRAQVCLIDDVPSTQCTQT